MPGRSAARPKESAVQVPAGKSLWKEGDLVRPDPAERLMTATDWLRSEADLRGLTKGHLGASTGAAAGVRIWPDSRSIGSKLRRCLSSGATIIR